MDNLVLSIIIPAYNEEKYISNCLKYILKAKEKGFINEIIVIDNNSNDNTFTIASNFPGIKVFLEKNQGTNFARQRGYLESSGDLIAFVDADYQMPVDRPEKVIKFFDKNKDAGLLTGGCLYYDGNFLQNIYAKFIRYIRVPIRKFVAGYIGNGGNMILKRTVLEKMGGLNTDLEFYGDDVNTARRASQISKCMYSKRIIMPASYRRFRLGGFWKTNISYIKAIYYEVVSKKIYNPKNKHYR